MPCLYINWRASYTVQVYYESTFSFSLFYFIFQHAINIKFKQEQMSHAHACTKIKFKINNVDMGVWSSLTTKISEKNTAQLSDGDRLQ